MRIPARFQYLIVAAVMGVLGFSTLVCIGAEWISGIKWPEPAVVTPGTDGSPPSDAIVLFDGKDLSQWENGGKWEVKDGYAVSKAGGIRTKQEFGSCQLHLEFASPEEIKGSGQGRGNSGVYLCGKYEVQILDSYENETYYDGQCGAIYKQHPPMVNASRKPGEWQSYDIIFNAPKYDGDGKMTKPATITVLHNGVLIQNNFEIQGSTAWHKPPEYDRGGDKGPISLQFHGNPVRFRNIWIRDIPEMKPLEG